MTRVLRLPRPRVLPAAMETASAPSSTPSLLFRNREGLSFLEDEVSGWCTTAFSSTCSMSAGLLEGKRRAGEGETEERPLGRKQITVFLPSLN